MNVKDYVGYGFKGHHKDGKVFIGVIKGVVEIDDFGREVVVIQQEDGKYNAFYMDEIGGWSASLVNGQPVLLRA